MRLDEPWVRVQLCVDGKNFHIGACERKDTPATLDDGFSNCACPSPYQHVEALYRDAVLLPTSSGRSVVWQAGRVPTSSKDASSSTSETVSLATVTIRTANSEAEDSRGGSGGLSGGAKAGIGVGVSLGALLVLGMMFLLIRRRKRAAEVETEEVEKAGAGDNGPLPTELPERAGTPPPMELAEDATRSELDVTESSRGSPGTWTTVSRMSPGEWNRVSGMSAETWNGSPELRSGHGSSGNWAEKKGNTVSELP